MEDYFKEVKEFFNFHLNQPFEFQVIQFTPKSFRVIITLENKRYESDLVKFRGKILPNYSTWAKMLSKIQGGFNV